MRLCTLHQLYICACVVFVCGTGLFRKVEAVGEQDGMGLRVGFDLDSCCSLGNPVLVQPCDTLCLCSILNLLENPHVLFGTRTTFQSTFGLLAQG